MSALWIGSAIACVAVLGLFLVASLRGDAIARASALVPATSVLAMFTLAFAAHERIGYLAETAFTLLLASIIGTLLCARVLERWL